MDDDTLLLKCRAIAELYNVKTLEVMLKVDLEYQRVASRYPVEMIEFYDAMALNRVKNFYKREGL